MHLFDLHAKLWNVDDIGSVNILPLIRSLMTLCVICVVGEGQGNLVEDDADPRGKRQGAARLTWDASAFPGMKCAAKALAVNICKSPGA